MLENICKLININLIFQNGEKLIEKVLGGYKIYAIIMAILGLIGIGMAHIVIEDGKINFPAENPVIIYFYSGLIFFYNSSHF